MLAKKIVYFGYNNMLTHKRGVENVIHFQSQGSPFTVSYYLHWDTQTRVSRYEHLICIGVKKNIFWFVALNFILLKMKKKNKKIFIHSHNPLMSIMSLYQSDLFTVHDGLYYLSSATKHKWNKVFWLLEKLLYVRCNYVHFISDYTKTMSLFKSSKNFVIIPNTSHFQNFKTNLPLVGAKPNTFADGVFKVFTVRSIEERALINLIVAVAGKMKSEKVQFLIAGKGPLLDFYRKKIKELRLENIILLGYVSDVALIEYYQDCDLVLVPAAYGEGFGLPIIEGYLFNKPVIASAVCAIPDVIISRDFLFENTVESMMDKLHFAKVQKQFPYRKYYDEGFSNKVVVSKMNDLYKKML
jgi:glycosyltransferase involved in cell wall biosynthesis